MNIKSSKSRINYEPNSWNKQECEYKCNNIDNQDKIENPRESKNEGFKTYNEKINNIKIRQRSLTFNDYYSQARQFFISQTKIEQQHIIDALTFELSKVKKRRN